MLLSFQSLESILVQEYLASEEGKERKMNGYSRIRKVSTERSKSIDYSHISFVPKTPNPIIKNHTSNPHDNKENQQRNTDIHEPTQGNENEDTAGEIFGVILSRKCSVSSNSTNNFLSEKQSPSSFNSAMKRTLSSIKRSSSVSDSYRRIHHQSDPPPDGDDDDILMLNTSRSRSMKKKGKFFKACKRMLGF